MARRRAKRRQNVRKGEPRGMRWAKVRLLAVFFLLVLSGLLVDQGYRWLTTTEFFRVQEVAVQGVVTLTTQEVLALAAVPDGANMFQLDLRSVNARIKHHPWIQGVRVHREFPRTLRITIQERTPVVYIHQGNRNFLADQQGIVMGEVEDYPWNLPVVYGIDLRGLRFGQGPPPLSLRQAIEVRNYLAADPDLKTSPFVGIEVTSRGDVVLHVQGMAVRLGQGGYQEKIQRYHEIAREVMDQGIPLKEVDLRFGAQVVVRTL